MEVSDELKQQYPELFEKDYKDLTGPQKRKRTMIERYGAPTTLQCKELREKAKQTTIKKYGVDNVHKADCVKEKTKETNLKKYGVENPMQDSVIAEKSAEVRKEHSEEITQKIKNTMLERYGVENAMEVPEFVDKITDTFMERYGVKRAVQIPEFKEKMIQTNQQRYGVPYYVMTDDFKEKQGQIISKTNRNFGKMLADRNIPYKHEFRLENYSYDFHIIDTNILVEIDPTYTHNVIGNHWSNGVEYDYHLKKSNVAKEHGFRCIHVFDWDDLNKICDMLLPKTRIRAHDTDIWILTSEFTNQFLKKYHLQGSCRGQILSLGLFKDGTCYMVMSFGRSRYNPNYDVELLRMCSLPGYSVSGGASKLFNYAVNTYELYSIISYCDYSKFNGSVYKELGMELIRTNRPQEVWSKDNKKVTANLLRQHGYDQLFHTCYGKQKPNQVLMLEHEWLPVFDCGQQVWGFKR